MNSIDFLNIRLAQAKSLLEMLSRMVDGKIIESQDVEHLSLSLSATGDFLQETAEGFMNRHSLEGNDK
jgi:hypothetical protein